MPTKKKTISELPPIDLSPVKKAPSKELLEEAFDVEWEDKLTGDMVRGSIPGKPKGKPPAKQRMLHRRNPQKKQEVQVKWNWGNQEWRVFTTCPSPAEARQVCEFLSIAPWRRDTKTSVSGRKMMEAPDANQNDGT